MPEDSPLPSPFEQLVKRLAKPVALGLILVPSLAWVADWAVWRVQLAGGRGMSQVLVSRIVVAPLKGNKEEYYPDGSTMVDCSQSLFPQGGSNPCWWINRHRLVQDR